MNSLTIPRSETGIIRVFAISRPIATVAREMKQQPKAALASALLGHEIAEDAFELFALSDLTGVGLPGYLAEGYDIAQTTLKQDRAKLEALEGYVLIVFSCVSDAGEVTLNPAPELTLIGSYSEPRGAQAAAPIATPSAKAYSGAKQPATAPTRSRVRNALSLVSVALTLLLIWWILQ